MRCHPDLYGNCWCDTFGYCPYNNECQDPCLSGEVGHEDEEEEPP